MQVSRYDQLRSFPTFKTEALNYGLHSKLLDKECHRGGLRNGISQHNGIALRLLALPDAIHSDLFPREWPSRHFAFILKRTFTQHKEL